MKVYTKTGDKGTTSLIGGVRVKKNSKRLESYGTIDELNSFLGMLRSVEIVNGEKRITEILEIQSRLFDVGAYLATEQKENEEISIKISESDIKYLEDAIDEMDAILPAMKYFILPGGSLLISYAHISRTVCRRAERNIISLGENVDLNPLAIAYINRLSDYLFMFSRWAAFNENIEEHHWIPKK